MGKILIVDDAEDVQLLVKAALEPEHEVISLRSGQDFLTKVEESQPHLVLLDVGLPDGDGFSIFREVAGHPIFQETPVLFLTGRKDPKDLQLGLSLGAEDYITKPFHPIELKARIEARLKKSKTADIVRMGPIKFDLVRRKVFVTEEGAEKELKLSPSEYQLLFFFSKNEGKTLSREEIRNSLAKAAAKSLETRVIDAQVSAIRRKSRVLSESLRSVYGEGYLLRIAK